MLLTHKGEKNAHPEQKIHCIITEGITGPDTMC
jgi:hypothetical protein